MNQLQQPTIALFPWGDLIEDFLDTINLSFESFCNEMTGGWLFGYVEALKLVGVHTVIFCVSARVSEATRYIHKPTGATICVLPAPMLHTWARRSMLQPYAWRVEEAFKTVSPLQRPFLAMLKGIAPYLANPIPLMVQELRREGCCAILCQEYEYARFDICVLLGKWLRLPVFATFQGGDFQLSQMEGLIRAHTLNACAGFIVASQVEIERLQKHYQIPVAKMAQIFNPLDLHWWQQGTPTDRAALRHQVRAELSMPLDAKIVICHGRIELYRKGLDILMDAWAQLRHENPEQNWWLLLVGTGNDAPQLRDRIASLPKQTVRWLDAYILDRSLIRRYLYAADLYTLPSRHEGFPVAPLEAMACGLPVVAADAPGVSDILEKDTQSGGIIVPREQPTALAIAIAQLLKDDVLRLQMAQHARNRMESCFSLMIVGEQLQRLMQR